MASKEKVKRMDWYKWFPRDILSSISYKKLTVEQQGAYRNILDHLWMEWPEVGVNASDDEAQRMMALVPTKRKWNSIKGPVLSMFTITDGVLSHPRLIEQRDETIEVSSIAAANSREQERIKMAEPIPSPRSAPAHPIDNNREEKIREDNSRLGFLDDLLGEQGDCKFELGALSKGTPGYFERGLYPGTAPKKIFEHIQAAWRRVRGEAAVARYPSKYPESWEELCTSGGDLLIPAFELWAVEEGKYVTNQYPTAQFVKDAQRYMERIIPLNATGPKKKVITGKEPELQAAFKAQDAIHAARFKGRTPEEIEADKAESVRLRDAI